MAYDQRTRYPHEAGTRPPDNTGVSDCGCKQRSGSPEAIRSMRSSATCGSRRILCGGGRGLAGRRESRRCSPRAGVAGLAEPPAVAPTGGRTEERAAAKRVRRGPAMDAGPDLWTARRLRRRARWAESYSCRPPWLGRLTVSAHSAAVGCSARIRNLLPSRSYPPSGSRLRHGQQPPGRILIYDALKLCRPNTRLRG